MSNEPNPFEDRTPWLRILFGGQLCRAALTHIDGVSTEDTWKEQASKETSGKVQVFSGTKKGKPKCTYLCHDIDSYRWLQEHWEMLKPVPQLGGTAGPVAPTGGAKYADPVSVKPGSVGSVPAASSTDTVDATPAASTSAATKDNPGPKPPTISVEYPSLLRHGITAVARGKWEDKGFTDTNGYEVEIEYVAQDPPKQAGAGALSPAKQAAPGSQFTSTANPGGGAGGASGAGAPGAASAAGT